MCVCVCVCVCLYESNAKLVDSSPVDDVVVVQKSESLQTLLHYVRHLQAQNKTSITHHSALITQQAFPHCNATKNNLNKWIDSQSSPAIEPGTPAAQCRKRRY